MDVLASSDLEDTIMIMVPHHFILYIDIKPRLRNQVLTRQWIVVAVQIYAIQLCVWQDS
jgi:hypothetical protein